MTRASRRRVPTLRLAACAAFVFVLPACNFGMNPGATEQGHDINGLYRLLFWFAIPIGALVYGLILWSVIRYRKRKGRRRQPAEATPVQPAAGDRLHSHPGR